MSEEENLPTRVYFEDIDTIARKIKEKRKSLGYSQRELAEMVGISNTTLSRLENVEYNPRYTTLRNLWNELVELEQREGRGRSEEVREVMVSPIEDVEADSTKEEAKKKMKDNDFSQLPVKNEDGEYIGVITEEDMIDVEGDKEVREFCSQNFRVVEPSTSVGIVRELLRDHATVLVKEDGEYVGIVNKADLM